MFIDSSLYELRIDRHFESYEALDPQGRQIVKDCLSAGFDIELDVLFRIVTPVNGEP